MSKGKVIKKTTIGFAKTISNLRRNIQHWNQGVDDWNEAHPRDTPRQKVKETHMYTAMKVYCEFIKKYPKGLVRDGKLRLTHSSIQGEHCVKTVYNHLQRLVQAGLIKKSRAFQNFGKGVIGCIELKLDENILDIQVEERFLDYRPLVRFNLQKLYLADEKRRSRQTLRFGDLLNHLSVKI